MDLKTLYNKTIDGIKYVMAQPTMMFRNRDNVEIVAYHIVLEDEIGRPDLIALKHYGDQSKTDMILKWNRISDPFSIMPGETLEIPAEYTPFFKLDRPTAFEDNKVKNEFVQGKKFSQKDLRRLEALKKKYNKETLLPPNVIPVGKKNYRFEKDGTVVLGAQAQNDGVVNSIIADLAAATGQDLRNELEAAQNGEFDFSAGSSNGVGVGGGGTGEFTETELDKALDNLAGNGGQSVGSGSGAGKADDVANNFDQGDAPESTNNSDGNANDGASCNT